MQSGGAFGTDKTGGKVSIQGHGDASSNDIGGIQLNYTDNNANVLYALVLDKDGIQMSGLPTSSSGLTSGAIWNSSGTLKIVT